MTDTKKPDQMAGLPDLPIDHTPARTRYEIKDASGVPVAVHVRVPDPDGGKHFAWLQPNGKSGLGGMPLSDLPLYGIERLGKHPTVVICEGEKAAQALMDAGIQAVGTVTGANSTPSSSALADLNGRYVVLWPDADPVGFGHMERIGQALRGIAASVSRIDWPDANEHDDAFDFLARYDVEEVHRMIDAAIRLPDVTDDLFARLGARLLSTIPATPPPPLLLDRLDPLGQTILYGAGGTGKGVLASWWIVQLVKAGERIVILDYENNPNEWSRRINGLAPDNGYGDSVRHVAPLTAAWGGRRGSLWDQQEDIRALAKAFGATFLVVDSIVPACGATDPMDPAAASQYAAAVEYIGLPTLSLAHVPKVGDPAYPFGSVFWHNFARQTWSLTKAGDGAGHAMILANRKHNNYAGAAKTIVQVTWLDGLPRSVWERPYAAALADRIAEALADESLSVKTICNRLDDEAGDGDSMVNASSVRKALERGRKAGRFTCDGAGTWRLAA